MTLKRQTCVNYGCGLSTHAAHAYFTGSMVKQLLAEPSIRKRAELTRLAADWRRSPNRPYSILMSDVQFIGRCYRCPITDVGRSLVMILVHNYFNQSKQIYVVPCVTSESEAQDSMD